MEQPVQVVLVQHTPQKLGQVLALQVQHMVLNQERAQVQHMVLKQERAQGPIQEQVQVGQGLNHHPQDIKPQPLTLALVLDQLMAQVQALAQAQLTVQALNLALDLDLVRLMDQGQQEQEVHQDLVLDPNIVLRVLVPHLVVRLALDHSPADLVLSQDLLELVLNQDPADLVQALALVEHLDSAPKINLEFQVHPLGLAQEIAIQGLNL